MFIYVGMIIIYTNKSDIILFVEKKTHDPLPIVYCTKKKNSYILPAGFSYKWGDSLVSIGQIQVQIQIQTFI